MIKTGVIVSNPFQENTIVLSDSTGECIIVDAGGYTPQENAALSKYIEQNGLRPVMAVNTHGHVDHMLGVNYVKDTYGVPFAIDGRDAFLIESAPTHGAIYGSTCRGRRRFVSAIRRCGSSRRRAIRRVTSRCTIPSRNCC